jgi:tyrosinase
VINIEKIGYTYKLPENGEGSVFKTPPPLTKQLKSPPIVRISGINRGTIAGSFALAVSHNFEDSSEPKVKAIESVLSRWHVQGCANCQNHLNITAFVPLPELPQDPGLAVHLHTRDNPRGARIYNVTLGYLA